jgi:hypothetical protein
MKRVQLTKIVMIKADVLANSMLQEINVRNVPLDMTISLNAISALLSIMAILIAKNVNVICTIQ